YLVALGVFAYRAGGPLAVGVVGLIRMVPAALLTPFSALLRDRYSRERVLLLVALLSAVALACSAVVFYLGPAEALIYVLAAFHAAVSTLVRPVLRALLASLAPAPRELVAANGVSMALESVGMLVGPVIAGVLVAAASPGVAFAFGAAASLLAIVLLARVHVERGLPAAESADTEGAARALLAGVRVAASEPNPRLIVGLVGAQTLVRGGLNVLIVVLTFRLLVLGRARGG